MNEAEAIESVTREQVERVNPPLPNMRVSIPGDGWVWLQPQIARTLLSRPMTPEERAVTERVWNGLFQDDPQPDGEVGR